VFLWDKHYKQGEYNQKNLIHKFLNEIVYIIVPTITIISTLITFLPTLLSIVKRMTLLQCRSSKVLAKLLGFWKVLGLLNL
jgi:hypothetical protein